MQRKKSGLSAPAMMLLIFSAALTSCATCPESPEPIELALDWPVFPNPGAGTVERDEVTGIVYMPLSYWLSIVDYKIDVERVRALVEIMHPKKVTGD